MLTRMQMELLQAAAKREQGSAGCISDIFAVALMMHDWDTCDYIAAHYASTQHFTQAQLALLEGYRQAAAMDAAEAATQH